ncbi:Orn/Lys/Arg decarboxylase N-terminal domain-containing protein [Shigella flexneri]
MMKVLIVESEFLHQHTWVGSAVERLADALSRQNVTVIKSTSFDDGYAILAANEAIDCLMFSYQMEQQDEHLNVRQLIGKPTSASETFRLPVGQSGKSHRIAGSRPAGACR